MNPRPLAVVVLALSLLVGGLSMVPTAEAAAAHGPNPPRGIHLSYLDDPTQAVITWHTATPATSRAEWGTSAGPPYPNGAAGSDSVSPGGSFLHTVTLTGLTPGTSYYYRVGDATMGSWYGQATFRAALAKGSTAAFSFTAAGDWGTFPAGNLTSKEIAKRAPNLVLGLGDYYYAPDDATVRKFYEQSQAFGTAAYAQPAMGNHELGSGVEPEYTLKETHCAFVNLKGNERTYAFTYGNTFFLALDWGRFAGDLTDGVDGTGGSCTGAPGTPAIRAWADAQLAAADGDPDIVWKVAYMHFPCYDTAAGPDGLGVCPGAGGADQIEDIFVNRGVDLVVTAHHHLYGRTHPVKFGTPMQFGSAYDSPGAPIYFIIGTGGHEPNPASCRNDSWAAACRGPVQNGGFGHFTVSPTSVEFEFVENGVGVVDSFTLQKTPATTFRASVEPASASMGRSDTRTATVSVRGVSANPVNLSVTGCPTGATCTFSPPSGSPNFTSTFTVTTGPSIPDGTYPLTIIASNGTVSRSLEFSLEVGGYKTLTFQKGDGGAYSETDDAHIQNAAPDANYGTSTTLLVDGEGCIDDLNTSHRCRTLLKFPNIIGGSAEQVSLNSVVLSATLEMSVASTGTTQEVYQVTEAWSEGTVTWNGFATPGFPANKGLAFTFEPSRMERISLNVTSIVSNWAKGDANQGIFVTMAGSDGVIYNSSESGTPPKLTVTFQPPSGSPPFDFSLSASPASGTVSPGGSANTSVTATPVSGTPETVSFSASGLPSGANHSFNPATCAPTCTTTLAVSTSPETPTGTYTITVTGSGGGVVRTTTYTLTVSDVITLTFQKGDGGLYSETDDAYIYNGAPDANFGSANNTRVDGEGCIEDLDPAHFCRTLLKFPSIIGGSTGQIPLNSVVLSAKLEISVASTGTTQEVYQVTEAWSEGTVTWNGFATPGLPANKGLAFTFEPGRIERIPLDVRGIVANWTAGDANQGIFVTMTGWDGVIYNSSESGTPPKLTVTFQPPSGSPPFDFTMSANPSSGTVSPGGSVNTSVTATLVSGTPENVSFSASGLPAGANATFSPATCAPTCTTTLAVSTSPETPTGTYPITITASCGGISRTATYTLVVLLPFDFALSVNPASGKVKSGESIGTTVTATLTSGSPQNVSFAASGLPSGASASFNPSECSPTCSPTMTISTAPTTPEGVFPITITGSGGGVVRTTTYTLTVSNVITLTFQKGDGGAYSETDDAYIYDGMPFGNYGTDTFLYVDVGELFDGCILPVTTCRSLIKFPNFIGPNQGQVPAGSTILSAGLEVQITNSGGTQSAYQVTEGWTESTVTWMSFATPGQPTTKGGPYDFAAPQGTVTLDVKAFVQNWVNGDWNKGLFITSSSTDGVDYRSSESSGPPKLTVTFRPPSAPPPANAPPMESHAHGSHGSVEAGGATVMSIASVAIVPGSGLIAFVIPVVRSRRRRN